MHPYASIASVCFLNQKVHEATTPGSLPARAQPPLPPVPFCRHCFSWLLCRLLPSLMARRSGPTSSSRLLNRTASCAALCASSWARSQILSHRGTRCAVGQRNIVILGPSCSDPGRGAKIAAVVCWRGCTDHLASNWIWGTQYCYQRPVSSRVFTVPVRLPEVAGNTSLCTALW